MRPADPHRALRAQEPNDRRAQRAGSDQHGRALFFSAYTEAYREFGR